MTRIDYLMLHATIGLEPRIVTSFLLSLISATPPLRMNFIISEPEAFNGRSVLSRQKRSGSRRNEWEGRWAATFSFSSPRSHEVFLRNETDTVDLGFLTSPDKDRLIETTFLSDEYPAPGLHGG